MTKLKDMTRLAGLNAGAEIMARTMRVGDIKIHPELSGIFTINEAVLASIVKSMKENGYDRSQSVVLWKGENCVVDGHTRLTAAREAGIAEIPVTEREFGSLEEAIGYAFKRQADRRNLTQPEIFQAAIRLNIKDHRDGSGRSGELLAKELNVPVSAITRARTVAARASEEDIAAVRKGELSINQAYQKVRKPAKPSAAPPETEGYEEPGDGGITDPLEGEGSAGDGGETEEPTEERTPDYSELGDSSSVKFLRSAVILLGEKQELPAADLLINHFLRKGKRELFLKILPRDLRDVIERHKEGAV
jgi:ParB family chromosome partitioning protein